MKNLMVYINPKGKFVADSGPLVKTQIENSIKLGWKPSDIILLTNFPFEYGQVKATVLKDVPFYKPKPAATKINAIVGMFDNGLIKRGQLYWFHDLDAMQTSVIKESEIGKWFTGIALTDYGGIMFRGHNRWSTGSMFFRLSAKNIFSNIKDGMYKNNVGDEEALGMLTASDPNISKRVKKINNTYNFMGYNFKSVYNVSDKPLRVVHFHPTATAVSKVGIANSYQFFKGNNPLKTSLLTDSLVRALKFHRLS